MMVCWRPGPAIDLLSPKRWMKTVTPPPPKGHLAVGVALLGPYVCEQWLTSSTVELSVSMIILRVQ